MVLWIWLGCAGEGKQDTAAAAPSCAVGVEGAALAGEGEAGFDAALAASVAARDRQSMLTAWANGATTEIQIAPEAWDEVEAFVTGDGWDFEAETGMGPAEAVAAWSKVAGAYAGVGFAADAYRYAELRDGGGASGGEESAELAAARARLVEAMEALHLAQEITGVEGVIARGYARADLPGAGEVETTPLFDEAGMPLPEEKDNGTWRADNSGLHPEMKWEDSCSRDQYIGWIIGMAAIDEVVRGDATVDEGLKARLREDARQLGRSLMVTRESGYDLEIRDADGRMTYHGILNEQSLDRAYVPGFQNGMNATMALGIVAALTEVSGDAEIRAWLDEGLIGARDLPGIARDWTAMQLDLGGLTNYSNYNMAFAGGWLALRYLCDPAARAAVAEGIGALYDRPGSDRQPIGQDQALYDWVYALARWELARQAGGDPAADPAAQAAVAKVVRILNEVPAAPYRDWGLENCDEAEVGALRCTLLDGTEVDLEIGDDGPASLQRVPMSARVPSNYYWRSNPYLVNGGGSGDYLYPNVDVRFVYWSARFVGPEGGP